jgi:hypothetical protein
MIVGMQNTQSGYGTTRHWYSVVIDYCHSILVIRYEILTETSIKLIKWLGTYEISILAEKIITPITLVAIIMSTQLES